MSTSEGTSRVTLELRDFIDGVPALAWSALPDGSLDFFNQRFRDYTGLSSEELYGSKWKSTIHTDDMQKFETWWHALGRSREAGETEVRLRRFDGEYRCFQIAASPVHDEQGSLVRWHAIGSDIHDRRCAEQKLRQDEQDLRAITDAIRQSIVVLAPDGTTLYANRVALDHTGLTVGEVNSKGFFARASKPSSRRKPREWGLGCRSVARSSKLTADSCGRRGTTTSAQRSISRCP